MSVYNWTGLDGQEDAIAAGRLSAQIAVNIPGLETLSMSARRDAALAECVAELGGAAPLTIPSITLTDAASKIIPGVTSLSLRNHADGADNLLMTDAGVATFRGPITTTQLTISTAVGKIIPGATSLSIRDHADTADNLLITDAGVVTARTKLMLGTGVWWVENTSGFTTQLALRNGALKVTSTAGSYDGIITTYYNIESDFTVAPTTTLTGAAFAAVVRTPAANMTLGSAIGFDALTPGRGSGSTITLATGFAALNQGGVVTGVGRGFWYLGGVGTGTIHAGMEIGAVSGASANNYGILIGNVSGTGAFAIKTGTGPVSFGDTLTATKLLLTTAASLIVPGATSIAFRNGADNADNLTITDAGIVTVARSTLVTLASATGQAGFRLPHGAAPSSPVDGDMWTTAAGGLFFRLNGVTKTVVVV